ncbi:MAG: PKD domain-containing protein [Cyclobacteriaceae bacterium]|nr:PKD domain-containing protein [Cyclobacteriaceae bacterium]
MPQHYRLILRFLFLFGAFSAFSQAPVTITQGITSGGVPVCVGGNPVNLTSIVIAETDTGDALDDDAIGGPFADWIDITLILGIPADFQFVPGVGSVFSTPGSDDVVINSFNILANSIEITFSAFNNTGTDKFDAIIISGLQVRAVSGSAQTLNITRTGGTASIEGMPNGTVVGVVTSVAPPASSLLASASEICSGEPVTFTASPAGQSNYEFFVNGFSVQSGPVNTYITNSLTTGQNVTVRITNAAGCTAESAPVAVTVNPNPTPSINGPNSVCANQAGVVYSIPLIVDRTYFWEVVSGGTIVGSATNNSVTVDWGVAGTGQLRVTETISATGCATQTPVFNVIINPIPLPNVAGADEVCADQISALYLYSTPETPGNTYNWIVTDGTITGGSGTGTIGVHWNSAGVGQVSVIETVSATGCSVTSLPFDVTIHPSPTPAIIGSNNVCANQTGVVYSTVNNADHTYSWAVTGGTIVGPSTNNSITVSWGVAGAGTVRVTETITATGCSTQTPIYNVTINANPTPAIVGLTTVCADQPGVVYSTANVVGNSYTWTVTGGSITSGAGTNSITVTWGPAGAGSVRLVETVISSGCSVTTANYDVTINANPAPVIAGLNTVCAGQSGVVYSTANVVGNSYTWTVTGGSITSGAGTNSITVTWGAAGAGTVQLQETIAATLCSVTTALYNVTINANPTPAIVGLTTVCADQPGVVYSTANVVGNSYTWTVTGGSITSGAGTNSITVTWGPAGAGSVRLVETVISSGCSVTTANYDVTINANPAPVIAGLNTVCAGQSGVVYSTANVVGNSYTWTVTGGSITSGAGTNSITVTWGAAGAGTVQLQETIAATLCSVTTALYNVTINANPTPAIVGLTTVCADQPGVVYSTANVVGNSYTWTVTGGSITSGAGTNSITVTWGPAGAGSVRLVETVISSGCSVTTANYDVTINANPAPVIAGLNTVCAGQSGVVYSTANVVGNSYTWTVTGGSITSGAGTNSITVTWGAAGAGTVQLQETIAATLCSVTTALYNVTINANPTPAIVGLTTVCADQPGVVYSTANVVGNSYTWTVTGGSITSGAGTNSITVTWGPAGAGSVRLVETVISSGCSVTTANYDVTINANPAPVIAGLNTVCAGQSGVVYSTANVVGNSYTWTVTGGSITSGAGTNSITVTWGAAGAGTVQLQETIAATLCSVTTALYNVTINANPTPAIVGLTTVCADQPGVVYSTANVVGNSYTWTVTGGSITSGAGTNSITVTWGPAGAGSVRLVETVISSGCSVTTANYDVTINANPAPVIAGLNTVCAGQSGVVYSTANVVGNSYTWTVTGGSITSGAGTNSITVTWGAAGAGTVQLQETIAATLCSVTTALYNVTINARPSPVIVGASAVCSNQSGVSYSTANIVGNSYLWEVVGGSITSGSGTSSILVTWGSAGVGSVTLTETISSTGCAVTTTPLVVTIDPSPTVFAGSDEEICQGSTFNFTSQLSPATATNFTTLLWTTTGLGILSNETTLTPTYVPGPLEFGTITFTLTVSGVGTCPVVDDQMILTITPTPVVDAGSNAEICQGNSFAFSTQTTLASVTNVSSVSWSHTGTGTLFNSTTLTPFYLPGPAETGTIVFTLQANGAGSCAAVTDFMELVITPSATVFAGSNSETCAGVTFNFATQATQATANNFASINWTTTGVGVLTNATTLTPSYTPDVADIGNITFTLTATGNGSCPSVQSQMVLTITPAPIINAGSSEEICEGISFNFTSQSTPATGANFSSLAWTTTGIGTLFNGNSLTPTYVPSAGETGTITFTLTANGNGSCVPVNSVMDLVITPRPIINAGGDAEVCQTSSFDFSTRAIQASGSNFNNISWTTSGSGTLSGENTLTPTYTPGVGEFGVITFTLIATGNGSCVSVQDQMDLTVTPVPLVDAGSTETICQGEIFNFANQASLATASNFGSISWSTTGIGTLFNANTLTPLYQPGAGETGTIAFTLTVNGLGSCSSVNDAMDLVITPAAIIHAGSDAETCQDVPFDFNTQFIPAFGSNYSSLLWTTTGSGIITGENTFAPVYTPGVGETGSITFTLTAFGNGVCPSVQDQMVLLITPGLTVDAGSSEEICQGGTFSFTSQSTGASASNFSSVFWTHDGAGSLFNANTLTPSYFAAPSETGVVTFTLTVFSPGSCGSIADDMELIITPAPVSLAGSDDAVCQGTPSFDFASRGTTASIANGTLVWSHNGTGTLNDATALDPVYTVGAGDVSNIITFTLTVTSPSAVCAVALSTFQLRVNPQALVSVPSILVDVCEPASIPLTGTIGGSATSGSWSPLVGDGTLSTSSITGLTITASYTTAITDVGNTLTFRLTTNDPDGAGPCVPAFIDVDFNVAESAKVNAGADFDICEYNDIILNGSFTGAATSVTWTGGTNNFDIATNPITGYTLSPAERAATNLSITFTLTTNDPPGVCPAVSDQVVVAVRDTLNFVTIVGLDPIYAENNDPVNINGVPSGGTFSGPGISGNTFFPSIANITPAINIITYTYQDPLTGCFSSPSKSVIVNPITDVDFRVQTELIDPLGLANGYICANQGDLILIEDPNVVFPNLTGLEAAEFTSTDLPAGRIYFDGTGLPENQKFKLRTDGLAPRVYSITYTYTNSFGAPNPVTRLIRVTNAPQSVITVSNACVDEDILFTQASTISDPEGYGSYIANFLWEFGDGNGSTQMTPTYNFEASGSGPGLYDVTLKVITNELCSNTSTQQIRVGDVPTPLFTWSEFCNGNDTKFTDQSTSLVSVIENYTWQFGDGFSVSGPKDGTIDPPNDNGGRSDSTFNNPTHRYDTPGQYNVILTIETQEGCSTSITRRISIQDFVTLNTPYFEDFNSGPGTWVATKANNGLQLADLIASDTSWVFGNITGSIINSEVGWWTGGNANASTVGATYYNNEKSAVIGPCVDLAPIARPMISIDYWSDLEDQRDGAVLQYSVNGGVDWIAVGDISGAGINWYNRGALVGNPGLQNIGQYGWTGIQNGWKTARFNLDMIRPEERGEVIFRVAFGSNNDNGDPDRPFEGFAFDNIYIGEKKRNVMVEYFFNSGLSQTTNDYLNNLFLYQTNQDPNQPPPPFAKKKSDFFKIQYHIANPSEDAINRDNPVDPAARALLYGVSLPPVAVMDGILGDYFGTIFNGDQTRITAVQVDKRALEDPLFEITVTQNPNPIDSINAVITFEYIGTGTFNAPVTFQMALVDSIVGTGSTANIHVLRKLLLGTEGLTVNQSWTSGTTLDVPVKSIINVPVSDGNNLWLVAFAQDRNNKRIHQSHVVRSLPKSTSLVVGLGDDPVLAQIQDIIVYPNPASKTVNFTIENGFNQLTKAEGYTWSIVDQRGVIVKRGSLNEDLTEPQQVEIDSLANGMYIVIFTKGDRTITHRKLAVMNRH